MQEVAAGAVSLAQLTGQSIDQTVGEFLKLQNDPVKAVAALNDSLHFLTVAQYDEISALQESGHTQQAAALAQREASQAVQERAKEVNASAGIMIRAWDDVKDAASKAWHAMENLGATQSVSDKLKEAEAQLASLQGTHLDRAGNLIANAQPGEVANLQATINSLKHNLVTQGFASTDKAIQTKATQDAINAQAELAKFLTPTQQLQKAINEANDRYAKAIYGVSDPALLAKYKQESELEIQKAEKDFEAATKKHKPRGSTADPLAGLSNMVAGLTTKSIGVPGDTALTTYVQGVAKLIDEFDADMKKKGADADRATALYESGIKALGNTLDNARQKQQALTDEAVNAYTASLDKANQALKAQIDAQIASVGMGAKEFQQQQQINQVYADQADKLRELALTRDQAIANGNANAEDAYKRDVEALQKATDQKVAIIEDGFKRMDDAQSNWANGAAAAIQDFLDAQKNLAAQSK